MKSAAWKWYKHEDKGNNKKNQIAVTQQYKEISNKNNMKKERRGNEKKNRGGNRGMRQRKNRILT